MMPMAPPQGQPVPQGQQQPPPVTIDAVMKLLRNDRMRGFRIDIETDSLVEADQTKERQDVNEFIAGIATFFKEFGPVVAQMPPLAPMASQLLCFAVRRYKVGAELEEVIEKSMSEVEQRLQNPAPPPPNPVEQAKLQIAQTKGQAEIAKANIGVQQAQTKAQAEQEKAQLDAYHAKVAAETTAQIEHEKALMDKEAKILDAELKKRADERAHELHTLKIAQEREAHAHRLEQGAQLHDQSIDKMHHDAGIKAQSAEQDISLKKDATSHEMKLKEKQAQKGEKPKDPETKSKLENLFADISKALTAKKKIVRDGKGEIVGIE